MKRGPGLWAALGAGAALLLLSPGARADQVDSRYGFAPVVGTGIAGLTHAAPLPGFVAYTVLGGELLGEFPPWGGFLRVEYLSSGQGGRWTALSFALGVSRRLYGEVGHLSLLARGGIAYEHWSGISGGCDVLVFVPNSCFNQTPPPAPGTTTVAAPVTDYAADTLGVVAGVRLELPIRPIYLAFDMTFVPTVDVDSKFPTSVLGLRLDLVIGFRDRRTPDAETEQQPTGPRNRRGG